MVDIGSDAQNIVKYMNISFNILKMVTEKIGPKDLMKKIEW